MKKHPLIKTLVGLRGNPRACLYPEPLWGIPYNLYVPYFSLYMISLGITDTQIGLLISIGTFFQIIFSLLGGVLTDKFGRKRVTFIFDILAWSIPCFIWAIAQNFTYFIIAAIINSMWRVTMCSWGCLFVEDAEEKDIINMWSLVLICGLLVAFISPLTGLFIKKFSLVSTMRVLLTLSCIMMTIKFIVVNIFSTETNRGRIRMEETQNTPILLMLLEYKKIFIDIVSSPKIFYTVTILLVITVCKTVTTTFWSIIVTEKILIPQEYISFFPFVRSIVMLIFFFFISHRISAFNLKKPMITGFSFFIFSQLLLITLPEKGYILLILSTILEAGAMAMIDPISESIVVLNANPQERSRMTSLIYAMVLTISLPFGYLSGALSDMNKIYPFILNMALYVLAILIVIKSEVAVKEASINTIGG